MITFAFVNKTPKKILIIRFSSMGDIVLTTPVIRCAKKKYPNAEIHYLTKSIYEDLLKYNPYISKIFLLKDNFSQLISQLKMQSYDLIIDLHKNYRSANVLKHLKTHAVKFNKINIRKWLAVNFKWKVLPDKHLVDRYFEALSKVGIDNDGLGLDYFIGEEDKFLVSKATGSHDKGMIAWAIGGQHNTKVFPAEKIVSVCKSLNATLIILGGENDQEAANYIEASLPGVSLINLCAKLNINQTASVIQQASLVLSNDTATMHIAAALKKKIISIWGNTIPEFGMYPYLADPESRIIENRKLSCRPCSKIGYASCPKKHFKCMLDIEEKEILDTIRSFGFN